MNNNMAKGTQEAFANLEIEMMTDMYNRLSRGCRVKCIPPNYSESELAKGEAVCVDRCVAKFLEIHDRIGKKLTEMYMKDQAVMKQMQGAQK